MTSVPGDADDRELTVDEAANVLNVSVDYIVDLFGRGDIPACDANVPRRGKATDFLDYKRRDDVHRTTVLDELAAEAGKHGLGY